MTTEAKVEAAALPPTSTRSAWRWMIPLALVSLAALVVAGAVPKLRRGALVDAQHAQALGPPRVVVAVVAKAPGAYELTLPGSVAPKQSSVVYARGAGFVRKFYVDLGDAVKAGQVLADIETPEVDEDVKRARARLDEAQKNVALTRAIAERAERLAKEGVSSQQQAEETKSRLNSAMAQVDSAQADADRLGALRGFSRVTAGFDGVVTRRMVELGTLVNPSQTPLFEIAHVATLKVTVDVPQSAAPEMKPGVTATVFLPSSPATTWQATVSRSAGALDVGTRTLRTELLMQNDGHILAGSYVQVRFSLKRPDGVLRIPAAALSVRAEGPQVWVVADGKVTMRTVQLGRDLGKELEVFSGLAEGDRVVLNPTDALQPGGVVSAVEVSTRGA
ncbi:MAG: efflux RND transporter periplasmic adaptor subunit [Archangium sp.]|nr:efflux RND transporter periplasmic adaptor subunit [Archangium sp.]